MRLEIKVSKTKVVVFERENRENYIKFYLSGQRLEHVDEFV